MTRTLSPFSLGYSILAGPVLWFVHFFAVYAVAEFGCRSNFNNLVYITPANIQVAILVLTVIALAAVAFGGALAYRSWQTLGQEKAETTAEEARFRFLSILGILFSGLFLLSILFTVAPTFVLNVCDKAV